jgi:hypothetical protein
MQAEIWQSFINGDMLAFNIFVVFIGSTIGATFADIDLAPPLPIKHRSAWTHGPLVPLAMFWTIGLYPVFWWFTVGFLPAFALHLFHDMFPKRWHGGAFIKLYPFPGSLGAVLSFLWLAGSVGLTMVWFTGMVWRWWS